MLSGAAVGGPSSIDAGGPRSGKGPVSEEFGHGIHVVDSGFVRPRLDAIHLIVERGRVAGQTLVAPRIDSVNTFESPMLVKPRPLAARASGRKLTLTVAPASVSVIALE